MEITTYLGDVRFLKADLVLAGMFEDERPPKGLAGQIDWYLYGQLTDLILKGKVTGRLRQCALLATQGKIAAPKFMVLGLGQRKMMGKESFQKIMPTIKKKIRDLMVQTAAIELFGNTSTNLKPQEAAKIVVNSFKEEISSPPAKRLIVMPTDKSQKELVEELLW